MIIKYLGIVFALILSALASTFFIAEYSAFWLSRQSHDEQFERLSFGRVQVGQSEQSQIALMRTCDDSQMSPFGRVQSIRSRRSLAQNCLSLAQDLLSEAPTLSLAHYVVALSQRQLGDWNAFNTALGLSQRTGSAEGWIAQRRFHLAASARDHLDRIGNAAIEQDAALLMTSPVGIDIVVNEFVHNEAVREVLLDAAEMLPGHYQRRFLSRLRVASE